MRKKLVAGNWKMNGSLAGNRDLVSAVVAAGGFACDVSFLVPAPYFAQIQGLLQDSGFSWGGQDLSVHAGGAYTGEIAGSMLNDFGCRQVIVGHSERRTMHHETDALIAEKTEAALRAGLQPILCVGESLAERDAGEVQGVLVRQLDAVLTRLGATDFSRGVVAYEPVWAIGTGRAATPEQVQAVHAFVRGYLVAAGVDRDIRLIYGGSVKSGNAASLFSLPDVDGALVGGAALDANDFVAICRAAAV